jgi:uncharacterized protein (TIGR04141 family)
MPRGTPQQKLTIALLKEDVVQPADALRDPMQEPESIALSEEVGNGLIYLRRSPTHAPGWKKYVDSLSPEESTGIASASPGALVVLEVDDRWYAISFGQGRHLIDPRRLVRGFGLRATLNLVDPSSLRAVDSSEWDRSPKHRRISTARRSSIRDFGITNDLELLRGATGTPRDQGLATQIYGRDSAVLWAEASPARLTDYCRELYNAYNSAVDDVEFPMFGNIAIIDDKDEIDRLDQLLLAGITDDSLSLLDLAPPEVINWESVVGFKIQDRQNRGVDPELELSIEQLKVLKAPAEWDTEWLKSKRILAVDVNYNELEHWSAYQCLLAELTDGEKNYALFAGEWFEINPRYTDRINASIQDLSLYNGNRLPDANHGEHEGDYNDRTAAQSAGELVCLDAQTIAHGGGRSRIEICDLLDTEHQLLIHVKDKYRSSGLSHLFTQAHVSAELLLEDEEYREKVRDTHAGLEIIFPEQPPDPAGYGVVLAIISPSDGDPRDQLPFLSKVRLVDLAHTLRRLRIPRLEIATIRRLPAAAG